MTDYIDQLTGDALDRAVEDAGIDASTDGTRADGGMTANEKRNALRVVYAEDSAAEDSDDDRAPLSENERARLDELEAAERERAAQPSVSVPDNAPPDRLRDDNARDADLPEAVQKRMDAPFYCPGCGRPFQYEGECTGASAAAPHPPIQTVSTDELHGDSTDAHTAAPSTEGI